ncbi:hypothetical protein FRACYDRAFT_250174 [Fragilariopsis cylindrus CCMP1102]|uniref:Uncharacterized protein n=1 Tax=Fragilariopsis cylindrus CCMP1102 TaxID=635003 RepID=A0A1E7EQU3_9STRA|nr:hypothetical protein FRACYDRAFT_250174 [Fragilariopsis cylindrus CCMP1102]|eukprot:OEU08380.1 hypothetical protein FRACYDRAFT_250174 [Fragilariopsis cylindrus CCMP1102]
MQALTTATGVFSVSKMAIKTRQSASALFVLIMMITLTSISTTALQLKKTPTSTLSSSSSSLLSSMRMMTPSSFSSSFTSAVKQQQLQQQFVGVVREKELENYYLSDIPKHRRDNDNDNDNGEINNNKKNDKDIFGEKIKDKNFKNSLLEMKETVYSALPPPPEDQFIITGDLVVLFLYAFTSHSFNDWFVSNELSRQDISLVEAVHELDPTGIIVNTNSVPSWVDTTQSSIAINHALDVSARESLLNHWGPLLSTEGSSCVALCTCWLVAGYVHRAFLYKNTAYCDSSQALIKTIQTWFTSALLLTVLTISTDFFLTHYGQTPGIIEGGLGYGSIIPISQTDGTGGFVSLVSSLLTQSDVTFIVDSLTVLIAWRWTANRILNSL